MKKNFIYFFISFGIALAIVAVVAITIFFFIKKPIAPTDPIILKPTITITDILNVQKIDLDILKSANQKSKELLEKINEE